LKLQSRLPGAAKAGEGSLRRAAPAIVNVPARSGNGQSLFPRIIMPFIEAERLPGRTGGQPGRRNFFPGRPTKGV